MSPRMVRPVLEPEAISYLSEYGISYPEHRFVTSAQDAADAADRLGYPIVLKAVSPDVLHKSDIGGVALDLTGAEAVVDSYERIQASVKERVPEAVFRGALVCKQAPPGLEVIVGALNDVTFGPAVMFGLGGVLAEILADTSFRVVPLKRRDAREMITEIRGYSLLEGVRGQLPYDTDALVQLLMKVSQLMMEQPEIEEMDLNPVRLFRNGLVALDVRILVQKQEA